MDHLIGSIRTQRQPCRNATASSTESTRNRQLTQQIKHDFWWFSCPLSQLIYLHYSKGTCQIVPPIGRGVS
jgi:hypothetical protein